MDKPEQWAAELRETLKSLAASKQDYLMDLTIQRAFEERERALRGQMAVVQQSHDWMYAEKQRLENALKDIASRAHANLAAVKDKP